MDLLSWTFVGPGRSCCFFIIATTGSALLKYAPYMFRGFGGRRKHALLLSVFLLKPFMHPLPYTNQFQNNSFLYHQPSMHPNSDASASHMEVLFPALNRDPSERIMKDVSLPSHMWRENKSHGRDIYDATLPHSAVYLSAPRPRFCCARCYP